MIVIFGYALAATLVAYVCLTSARKLRLPDVLPSLELMSKIAKNRVVLSEIRSSLVPAKKLVDDFLGKSEDGIEVFRCLYLLFYSYCGKDCMVFLDFEAS